MFQLLCSK